jgi:hypothetical protein
VSSGSWTASENFVCLHKKMFPQFFGEFKVKAIFALHFRRYGGKTPEGSGFKSRPDCKEMVEV